MSITLQTEKSALYSYYRKAEEEFIQLIQNNDLDSVVKRNSSLMANFEDVLSFALYEGYKNSNVCDSAHLFIQRVLYYINRLKFFWFDDLENYTNENSTIFFSIRKRIETEWMKWELNHIETDLLDSLKYEEALSKRFKEDLNPLPSK